MNIDKLNIEQKQAVLHGNAPLLVLAGAGSGKTTVITYRIAQLIREHNVWPNKILAVTFTNKAAKEMKERTLKLCKDAQSQPHIGTFHSICVRILREFAQEVGLNKYFTIYDDSDRKQLIRQCLKELNLDPQVFTPKAIAHKIDQWKNAGLEPKQVVPSAFDMVAQKALNIYILYQKRCLEAKAVDFGDLLLMTLKLLKQKPEVLETLQRRWHYFLVDEYQDTNPVQYQWLRLLAGKGETLTVVGDDDQSIYRWRGADIANILRFEKDFPGASTIRLEQNYRSTKRILAAANTLIANNTSRKGKTLFSDGELGSKISFRLFPSERDEGEAIGQTIAMNLMENNAPQDYAILYRTNAQSRPIEDALRRRNIPYKIYGGIRFYDRKEVKDALAYLKLLVNPNSDVDFLRVVNVPTRGIGKTTLEKVQLHAQSNDLCLLDAARELCQRNDILASRSKQQLLKFVVLVDNHTLRAQNEPVTTILHDILTVSGYLASLEGQDIEKVERLDNLSELMAACEEFEDLSDTPSVSQFLEEAALATELDSDGEDIGHVSLMTLHTAKGLEFTTVYIPGLEESLLPHSRSQNDIAELEEERRLCYVGFTRAKNRLNLSAARSRSVFGETRFSEISRFITEIPDELLELHSPQPPARPPAASQKQWQDAEFIDEYQGSSTPETNSLYQSGQRISHATFGEGTVMTSQGKGRDEKLTVNFPNIGHKIIVARFVEPI
ncbi:MAG: UvrD-helicase domain-containing protein [Myxococcota bacterium]|jgi:DNA helicase-2/ATP-dependent DNA helicase PcrA|nr:UvrD-helicase domain-containing protein [Myxococcota bacterium]